MTINDKKNANLDNVAKYILYKNLDKNNRSKCVPPRRKLGKKLIQLCENNDQTRIINSQ